MTSSHRCLFIVVVVKPLLTPNYYGLSYLIIADHEIQELYIEILYI